MANRLTVKLDGQEYTIVSEESREYMLEVSDMVNAKLSDIKIQNNRLSSAMAAMLVALNLGDELKKTESYAKEKIQELEAENAELKKRLDTAKQYVQNKGIATPVNGQTPYKK